MYGGMHRHLLPLHGLLCMLLGNLHAPIAGMLCLLPSAYTMLIGWT